MLSPSRANHLVSCFPRLSLNFARSFATTSNEGGNHGQPQKSAKVASKEASEPLVSSAPAQPQPDASDPLLAASLNHYHSLPPLPPIDNWLSHFAYASSQVRDRISIRAPASAISVAHSFINSKKTSTNNPKVIVEAFPGPGALSRAFLTLPPSQLRRLIILEDHEPYLEYLRPLAQADPRVRVVSRNGFSWDTYSYLAENGDLDVDIASWEKLHPELHFVSHIPQTIHGEQLVAQLFRCIPEKSWLFKYGRIPMSFILADWVWRRISASIKTRERCKLSVIAEASSHFSPSLLSEKLSPFSDHFHPAIMVDPRIGMLSMRPETRRRGSPFLAINVLPHDEQVIDKGMLNQWDYILRRLFVLKSTPLRKAINSLAPGAEVLLNTLTDKNLPPEQRVDVRLMVKQLTISDWALIVRAFDAWPFAPVVCPFINLLGRELNALAMLTQELDIDSFVSYERDT
ncbi:S-adenosyl-L-methionine-dependent methyltransferase [Russula aff. rugulosa BPL654]|nr:S-adenosyl-L-methionine-dependent methyltransferase [Russula aff. rugulosa BPL654]